MLADVHNELSGVQRDGDVYNMCKYCSQRGCQKQERTSNAHESACSFEFECPAESTEQVVRRKPQNGIGGGEIGKCQVQESSRNVLGTYQSFVRLHCPRILAVFGFGPSDSLEDVSLLGALEIHDDFSVVCPKPKSRVIVGRNRGRCLFHVSKSKDVVYCCMETETRVDFLLLSSRYLDELNADFDNDLDFPSSLRQAGDRLEHVSVVGDKADRFLRQVKLAQVEV